MPAISALLSIIASFVVLPINIPALAPAVPKFLSITGNIAFLVVPLYVRYISASTKMFLKISKSTSFSITARFEISAKAIDTA